MSNDEEPVPSAALSENEDDKSCSDTEKVSRTRKRCKTGLTKCEDEYAVSQQRQALSAKGNTGKFLGLRAEKPAKANAAKTLSVRVHSVTGILLFACTFFYLHLCV